MSKWNEARQKDVMETNEINEQWSVAMMSFIDEFHHENKEIEEFIERINNIRGVRTDNHIGTSQTNPFFTNTHSSLLHCFLKLLHEVCESDFTHALQDWPLDSYRAVFGKILIEKQD